MPCPDCEKLHAELEAFKAEFEASRATFAEQKQRILDQMDQVIAGFNHKHQELTALADCNMHASLARLDRLEAALRFPRGEPPEQSEPPPRH